MKKCFTLAAFGLLSCAAHAQIMLNGTVTANEIGPATEGKYELAGQFTTPHPAGYGDWGITKLYVANTDTKMYIMLVGTVQKNGNALQLHLDVPGITGIPVGTALPGGPSGTAFELLKAKLETEADLALALRVDTAGRASAVSYLGGTGRGAQMKQALGLGGSVAAADTALMMLIPALNGMRMAYKDSPDGTVDDAGNTGWEIELDRAALGLPKGRGTRADGRVNLFALMSNNTGEYLSYDVIPEIPGRTTNLDKSDGVDFTALPGSQVAAYQTGTGVLASRAAVARALGFAVYPNPARTAQVAYTVPGQQDVALEVYNLLGQRVRTLVAGKQAGTQLVAVSGLQAGTYLVRLRVGDQTTSQRVVVR